MDERVDSSDENLREMVDALSVALASGLGPQSLVSLRAMVDVIATEGAQGDLTVCAPTKNRDRLVLKFRSRHR